MRLLNRWARYDVMNDMAFGGGTDMLREGDVTGHWAVLESGLRYYRSFPFPYWRISERFRRIFTLLGHLPWLARFIPLIPGRANDLDSMRKSCFERAMARKKKGTEQKDLFYYLVSIDNFFVQFIAGALTRPHHFHSLTNWVQKKRKYHPRL